MKLLEKLKIRKTAYVPAHRWIGGMTDIRKNEAHLYQAKPGFRYQTDFTYGEHLSILDDAGVASLVEQVQQGAKMESVMFHHFTNRHADSVAYLLEAGDLDWNSRMVVQHLVFAAYNHAVQYTNLEIAELILSRLFFSGYDEDILLHELAYYHGNLGMEPDYLDEFGAVLRSTRRRLEAEALAKELEEKAAEQRRTLKV